MAYIGAIVLIVLAFVTDVRSMRIPNWLTGASFAAAMLFSSIASGSAGLLSSLLGALAGFVPLLMMYAAKGIGAGDVKLFAALGAWLGTQEVLGLMMYSILYAGAIGLLLLACSRIWPWPRKLVAYNRAEDAGREPDQPGRVKGTRFPFMLAVAPAAATCWWLL